MRAERIRAALPEESEAEPSALRFYERMGGRSIGYGEPTEWGRVLPTVAVELR